MNIIIIIIIIDVIESSIVVSLILVVVVVVGLINVCTYIKTPIAIFLVTPMHVY